MTSSHCIQFSLDNPTSKNILVLSQRFNGWKELFKLPNDTAVHILDKDGFKTLFGDLHFYLYTGHTLWVMNQNNAIENLMAKINDASSIFCGSYVLYNEVWYNGTARECS